MFAVERMANIKDNPLETGPILFNPRGSELDFLLQKGCCFSLSDLSTEREKNKFTFAISAPQR